MEFWVCALLFIDGTSSSLEGAAKELVGFLFNPTTSPVTAVTIGSGSAALVG